MINYIQSKVKSLKCGKDHFKSILILTKIIELFPEYEIAWLERAKFYNSFKYYEQSIKDSTKILEQFNNNSADAYLVRGVSYFGLKKYYLALDDFHQNLKLKPNNNFSGLVHMSLVYFKLENYEKSLEFTQECLKLFPNCMKLMFNLGVIYIKMDYFVRAIKIFTKLMNYSYKNVFSGFFISYQANKLRNEALSRFTNKQCGFCIT